MIPEHKIEFTNSKGVKKMMFLSRFNKHKNEKWLAREGWHITDAKYLLEQQHDKMVAERAKVEQPKIEQPKTENTVTHFDIPDFINMSVKKIKNYLIDKKPELDEAEYRYMNKADLTDYAISKCK